VRIVHLRIPKKLSPGIRLYLRDALQRSKKQIMNCRKSTKKEKEQRKAITKPREGSGLGRRKIARVNKESKNFATTRIPERSKVAQPGYRNREVILGEHRSLLIRPGKVWEEEGEGSGSFNGAEGTSRGLLNGEEKKGLAIFKWC